jgi:ketosteroid isomerase-like protein
MGRCHSPCADGQWRITSASREEQKQARAVELASGHRSGDTARAMSQENVEIVRAALAALDRRDVDAYLALASPEIEVVIPAAAIEGPLTGHEGMRRFFAELVSFTDRSSFQVEEVRAVGARVLSFHTFTTVGRTSGAETSMRVAGVYDVENGKIRRAHIFVNRAEALEAVGLSE